MCIKDLQTQVTSLLSIKEKRTKANTDWLCHQTRCKSTKSQMSNFPYHICYLVVINYENEVISIAPIHWDK